MLLANDPLIWMFRNRNSSFYACGYNAYGQLGDGTKTNRTELVKVTMPMMQEMTAGSYFAAGIDIEGNLWRWGCRDYARLGDGLWYSGNPEVNCRLEPYTSGERKYKSVAAVGCDTYAIGMDGCVYRYGETSSNTAPTLFFSSAVFSKIFFVNNSCMAIDIAGHLWGWGRNTYGRLGLDPNTYSNISTPVQIGTQTWRRAAIGLYSSLMIDSDGCLWAVGKNSNYNFLNGSVSDSVVYTPVQIGSKLWKFITTDCSGGSFAIDEDGYMTTNWSATRQNSSHYVPSYQFGSKTWNMISCKISSGTYGISCAAIDTDHHLWTWGDNEYGQLGDGTSTDRAEPQQIGSRKWKNIFMGADSLYAIPL